MAVEWYFRNEGAEKGPIPSAQLKEFAEDGIILPSTPVRRISGLATSMWVHAGDVRGLFAGVQKKAHGPPICPVCGCDMPDGFCLECVSPPMPPLPNRLSPESYEIQQDNYEAARSQIDGADEDIVTAKRDSIEAVRAQALKIEAAIPSIAKRFLASPINVHQRIRYFSKGLIIVGGLLCFFAASELYSTFDHLRKAELLEREYSAFYHGVSEQKTDASAALFSFVLGSLGAFTCFVISACIGGFASIVNYFEVKTKLLSKDSLEEDAP